MIRKFGCVVVNLVVAAGMMVSVALADTISGQVQSVDAKNGRLTIMTEEGDTKQFFSVPNKLLQGVQPGHEVDVEVVGSKVRNLQNYSLDD